VQIRIICVICVQLRDIGVEKDKILQEQIGVKKRFPLAIIDKKENKKQGIWTKSINFMLKFDFDAPNKALNASYNRIIYLAKFKLLWR